MATPIAIPKSGWEMEEGTLLEWLVPDGSTVDTGDPLYLLETDKANVTVEAPCAGVIRIKAEVGQTYKVGHEVAEIE